MVCRTALITAICVLVTCSSAVADYSVADEGLWPGSWPQELEPLRKQARTLEGPKVLYRHYLIPFTDREQFEAAWPHLLKVKSKGAPLILVRGPKTDFFEVRPAGVAIHTPPVGEGAPVEAGPAKPGQGNPRSSWIDTAYIELAVDGKIVDLNRIELPADTPIIDKRFKEADRRNDAGAADRR
jgi:hypothetical protein